MPLLDIQRQGQQTGRIRLGKIIQTDKGPRPVAIDTFRFTTASEYTVHKVADLYDGTVERWRNEWEVITSQTRLYVLVPPRDAVISQWYEKWNKGGCERRCDSITEQLTGGPCLCPHAKNPADPEQVLKAALERDRLAKTGKACSRRTRLNVMIPDLPDLGVWRLDTGSFWAASEMADKVRILEAARAQGIYLPAVVRSDPRARIKNGMTTKFNVPVVELLNTVRELVSGQLRGAQLANLLPPAPDGQHAALPAGTGRALPAGPEPVVPPAAAAPPRPEPEPQGALPLDDDDPDGEIPDTPAQRLVYVALQCQNRAQVESLAQKAEAEGLGGEYVCADVTEPWEPLRDFLRAKWTELPETRQKPSQRAGAAS